jgi:hypothetical protein
VFLGLIAWLFGAIVFLLRLLAEVIILVALALWALLLVILNILLRFLLIVLKGLKQIAPWAMRVACVVCALWSLVVTAWRMYLIYCDGGAWRIGGHDVTALMAGWATAIIVIVLAQIALSVYAAVRQNKEAAWGCCLWFGGSAWAAVFAIEWMNWDQRAIVPVAFILFYNPVLLLARRQEAQPRFSGLTGGDL